MQELTKEELIDAIFKAVGSEATYAKCLQHDVDPVEWVIDSVSQCRKSRDDLWKDQRNKWKKVHERALKDVGVEIESRYIKVEDLRKLSIGEIADKIAEIDSY